MSLKKVKLLKNLFPSKEKAEDSFHQAMRPYIVTGQLFGIFPLSGIYDVDPNRIRLAWPTLRVLLGLVVLGAGIVNSIAEYLRLQSVGVSAKNINGLIFFIDGCIINVLFLMLATKWKRVAVKWDSVDRIFLTESYRIESRWTLKRRLWTATAVLLGFACCEHLLATVNNLNNLWYEIEQCGWRRNITDSFRHVSLRKFSNMYLIVPYSAASAVFFTYISCALTLYWNYLDVFIILVSIAIATRFDQLNNYLRGLAGGGVLIPNEPFWIRVRSHYVSLCELLDEVDRAVAWIVLLSCATNLYFICLQILNVSQKLRYAVNDVYYWFSLLFLIGRTATLFLCAAHIHEAAKKPLDIVANIPNNGWNVELDRFSSQLKSETIALSGMGFFHITRQLLFSMAGTIVTYELVMLKFDKESEGKGYIRPCSFFDIEKKCTMIDPLWRDRYKLWKKTKILQSDEIRHTSFEDNGPESDYFHIAIAPVLKFSQFFGVFPLHSVMERLPQNMSFKMVRISTVLSLLAIVGGYAVSAASTKRLVRTGLNAINMAEPFFFAICATSAALFWALAKEWQFIATMWSETEREFLHKPFRCKKLKNSIRRTATLILTLAFAEHIFSVANNIANLRREIKHCNWTITNPVKHFCLKTFSSTFDSIPYNLPVAIYNEYVVVAMTFAWNFVDLFIVLISIGLTTRFTQLNIRISEQIRSSKGTSEDFWERIRLQYVSLCDLVVLLNRYISRLVFVSYANDLYFICLQIMNATLEQPFLINRVYFYYSFSYLLLRTSLMFWYSSQVQDASHQPCRLILHVPNHEYCDELQRVQMYSRRGVSLTGMGVFLVSRRIFLTIAGTIITYELVLISFRKRTMDQSVNNDSIQCEPLQLD
ncbi:uncharacterized protein LOC134221845 [Armigeres subalbatus]|uniref:uncharacterized protein LOC134221845 n=1 Tax=Armigeres subalbatus TaxID=124917 RepID=UPI002ED558B3